MFEDWSEEERSMIFFRVVLELGLILANKKPSKFPMANRVTVKRNSTTKRKVVFIVTSSNSNLDNRFTVTKQQSHSVKTGTVTFLRLRGLAGVPWMDTALYDVLVELLEGPFAPKTISLSAKMSILIAFGEEVLFFLG